MTTPETTPGAVPRQRKERKENADKRRQQLLDATWRSIAQNGLGRTTLATVAAEAGLSQGVAVFYFKSKAGLLIEALRDHYARYQENWERALKAAGDDPAEQLIALIRADFDEDICNPEALSIWYAFWGEMKFTSQYAEISSQFDAAREQAMRAVCGKLMGDAPGAEIARTAQWIDTFSDGFWQRLHVFPGNYDAQSALRETLLMAGRLVPQVAGRIEQNLAADAGRARRLRER
ncbi:TetR family transcriptional regulator [Pelagivirga sediminicola]|uniref:TetR family transcriptional regulator n=2 Tax=Pelagivirga sediminicola TaxID=2170575 RepID=A0A2T7GCA8_9RHOB|nr:TetR family transcriptional regulator [Pelagivirga sediminicola]